MSKLNVYSGEVRLCKVGIATGAVDYDGKPISTGDIIMIWADGSFAKPAMTVAVDEGDGPFVMGIKSVPMDAPGEWNVWKIKDHADVVAGEHWPAWGFRFLAERDRQP